MKHLLITPWGDLETWVTEADGLQSTCVVGPVQPRLRPHMSVDGCLGAVWRISADREAEGVGVHIAWSEVPKGATGGASPGEGLDAMTWDIGKAAVSLGTQDGDVLAKRARSGAGLPKRWAEHLDLATIRYTSTGLFLPLPAFREGDEVSLHFLVAWERDANDDDPWTWFAVEQDHELVVADVAG